MTTKKIAFGAVLTALLMSAASLGFAAEEKSKFYDFSDQLIDGDIKKPTQLYMEGVKRAKFGKLLKLKKSFRPAMIETAKERQLK
jgi:hypothetical protein